MILGLSKFRPIFHAWEPTQQVLGRGCLSEKREKDERSGERRRVNDVSQSTILKNTEHNKSSWRFCLFGEHVRLSNTEPSVDQSSRGRLDCIAFSQYTVEYERHVFCCETKVAKKKKEKRDKLSLSINCWEKKTWTSWMSFQCESSGKGSDGKVFAVTSPEQYPVLCILFWKDCNHCIFGTSSLQRCDNAAMTFDQWQTS